MLHLICRKYFFKANYLQQNKQQIKIYFRIVFEILQ